MDICSGPLTSVQIEGHFFQVCVQLSFARNTAISNINMEVEKYREQDEVRGSMAEHDSSAVFERARG